jgi:hypothetical protein
MKQFGVKTELVVNPIMVQLAQGIARPSLSIMLEVELFCKGIQFSKNFTLCELDNFDAILTNTFLDAYEIDILHNKGKLKICAKSGSKLMNLNAHYNFALVEMGVSLVVLVNMLKSPSFLVLMSLKVSQGEPKPQRPNQPPTYFGFTQ